MLLIKIGPSISSVCIRLTCFVGTDQFIGLPPNCLQIACQSSIMGAWVLPKRSLTAPNSACKTTHWWNYRDDLCWDAGRPPREMIPKRVLIKWCGPARHHCLSHNHFNSGTRPDHLPRINLLIKWFGPRWPENYKSSQIQSENVRCSFWVPVFRKYVLAEGLAKKIPKLWNPPKLVLSVVQWFTRFHINIWCKKHPRCI